MKTITEDYSDGKRYLERPWLHYINQIIINDVHCDYYEAEETRTRSICRTINELRTKTEWKLTSYWDTPPTSPTCFVVRSSRYRTRDIETCHIRRHEQNQGNKDYVKNGCLLWTSDKLSERFYRYLSELTKSHHGHKRNLKKIFSVNFLVWDNILYPAIGATVNQSEVTRWERGTG